MEDDLLKAYESLDGVPPSVILDRHPDGRFVALQAHALPLDRAAIWDAVSGKLVWQPADTIAVIWLKNGRRILLVREKYEPDPRHPLIVASPLQSEYQYSCEQRSWPEQVIVGTYPFDLPTGWPDRVVVSPQNDLAAIRWIEQDCAGFVLVQLHEEGDRQLAHHTYRTEPNLIQGPVFSPDGRFLVLSCGRAFWWNDEGEDPRVPATGGQYEIDHVTIYEVTSCSFEEFNIEIQIPSGWLPSDPDDISYQLLGEPEFLSATKFRVALPTGGEQQFSTLGDPAGR